MECNKDEAIKCKGIAEKKLENGDIAGANKFALKAQRLFPNIEGLSALLEVVNLYVASQKKINGEMDLYGILGLDPSVDDDTLREKYRKMALVLHPDKNKSIRAAGAFLILTHAFNILSDKDKRSAYNLKLNRAQHAESPRSPPQRQTGSNSEGFEYAQEGAWASAYNVVAAGGALVVSLFVLAFLRRARI